MATAVQKITLSASRDIPFNKLILSQSNVRRIKAGVSIEELAEDIGRRTLLQSLTVRPVRDADGVETGMFEIPAGGRRYRALELLVKQKRLAKTAPVPCVVREGGIAEEDSLAENVQRAPLHPLDQFRAFGAQAPGLNDTALAANFDRRHQAWVAALPKEPAELWDTLTAFDGDSRQALFAHCVSLSVNAMFEAHNRRPRALAHADRLAQALGLDMITAGWSPTVENYLGRVTKAQILGAVREAKGEQAAQLIDHLKKGEMAEKAEVLLAGSGWLPEPLRTPGRPIVSSSSASQEDAISALDRIGVETAAGGYETAMAEIALSAENEVDAADPIAVVAE